MTDEYISKYEKALHEYEMIRDALDELEHTLEILHKEYELLKMETQGIKEKTFSAEISHPMTHVRGLKYCYRQLKSTLERLLQQLEELTR